MVKSERCSKCHCKSTVYTREVPKSTEDLVNSPKHYNQGSIECIDAMKAMCAGVEMGPHAAYLWQNSFKYLWRHSYKDGKQDLEKARWYLDRLIGTLYPKLKEPQ